MDKTLGVSQPMFLPWIGLFEQIKLSDVFVHYDDVQLPNGRSFMSRVQIKSANGAIWLTAPLDRKRSGTLIKDTLFSNQKEWRIKHLKTIKHAYSQAPFFDMMYDIIDNIYNYKTNYLSEFNINALEYIAQWLGLTPRFLLSSDSGIKGRSTQRLVDLSIFTTCDVYVTGLGALKYLDHEQFEANNISVRYMDYKLFPYPQMFGDFTPYVSILDAIANCGNGVRELICSKSTSWREYNVK